MKITAVEPVVVNAGMRNWIFVVVRTDQDGLEGIGEATLEFQTQAVAGAVEDLAELIINRDPREFERLWQIMFRHPFFKGGPVTLSALSGIDQALHDIVAKDLGVPLYRLLGGLARDRVRLYDHLGGGESAVVYDHDSPSLFAERAAESREAGFTALKILPVGRTQALNSARGIAHTVELVTAARDGAGDDVEIMVDFHGRTSSAAAIEVCRAIEHLRPWFVEKICAPDRPDELLKAARSVAVAVAAGERLYGWRDFLTLLGRSDRRRPTRCLSRRRHHRAAQDCQPLRHLRCGHGSPQSPRTRGHDGQRSPCPGNP